MTVQVLLLEHMDTVFFVIAKLVGALLRADTWLVLALAAVLFVLMRQKHRAALWITVGTFVSVVSLSIFHSVIPSWHVSRKPIQQTRTSSVLMA